MAEILEKLDFMACFIVTQWRAALQRVFMLFISGCLRTTVHFKTGQDYICISVLLRIRIESNLLPIQPFASQGPLGG